MIKEINYSSGNKAVCLTIEWRDSRVFAADIVFVVPVHNNEKTIKECINSILSQSCNMKISILILDDNSNDLWREKIDQEYYSGNIVIVSCNVGSAWKIRNLAKMLVDQYFYRYSWLSRLDSDDTLVSDMVVSKMIKGIQKEYYNVLWVLASNLQNKNGLIVSETGNRATNNLLLDNELLKRLKGMSNGKFDYELPSCNLWLARGFDIYYPAVKSAEDHWLVTYLLIMYKEFGCLLPNVLHTNYSLSGATTKSNRKMHKYIKSRKKLYDQAILWIKERDGMK